MEGISTAFLRIDGTIRAFLKRWSLPVLRWSLGIVFVWFGALKIFGVTPVTDLVADTVYWFDPDWVVPALGVFEVLVGVGLVTGLAPRIVLGLLVLQLAGTFLVFVVQPDVAFEDGNPLLLTVEGEFVAKNLVLIAAAFVIGSTIDRAPRPMTRA
ncbi:MAG: DoxX family protein [Acidimicrobiia bacterium]|nr:DoxX family protein [Acidimicrobiia bacterium]